MATKKAVKKEVKKNVELEVTQELYDLNKEFFDENEVAVGDTCELSKKDFEALAKPAEAENVGGVVDELANKPVPSEKKAGKIVCPLSILSGEEYVRTYPKGQEAEAQEFLSKNPNFVSVSPEDIASITVSFREIEKKKDSQTGRLEDTGRLITRNEVFTESSHGADWMKKARAFANEGQKRSCIAKLVKNLRS